MSQASRASGGAGLKALWHSVVRQALCFDRTRLQLWPYSHWCECPKASLAPGRRLKIGEARL